MANIRFIDFNTTRDFGQMNTNKAFYKKGIDAKKRRSIMETNKQRIMCQIGLRHKDVFIPIQKNNKTSDKYEDGKCYTLTKEDIATYEDLYDYDVYADVVKVTSETPNVAIAYPVADCAVVKAVNFKTNEAVLAHCGGEYIDRFLPMQTIDALGGKEEDINVYVSPFAHTLFYDDATKLVWANNPLVWEDCIEEKENNGLTSVKIDVYKALRKQLLERKIPEDNIEFSPYDISTSDLFFSNHKQYSDKSYAGRFLSGIAIVDNYMNIEEKPQIKILRKE